MNILINQEVSMASKKYYRISSIIKSKFKNGFYFGKCEYVRLDSFNSIDEAKKFAKIERDNNELKDTYYIVFKLEDLIGIQ